MRRGEAIFKRRGWAVGQACIAIDAGQFFRRCGPRFEECPKSEDERRNTNKSDQSPARA